MMGFEPDYSDAIWRSPTVARLLDLALEEDLGHGDVTTQAVAVTGHGVGDVIAKQPLVCAGGPLVESLIERAGLPLQTERLIPEGGRVAAGDAILRLAGPAAAVLQIERTALNFLMRMSGVATLTRMFVDEVGDVECRVVDTRKTIPGWRLLDKYAVRVGGGQNHRADLGSGVLIKDNHIEAAGSVSAAVSRAKRRCPHPLRVEVEVESLSQLYEALEAGAEVVLLDNMSPDGVKEAVERVEGRALVEVSGGVSLNNVREYAEAGADVISIGALTHSAPAVDLSLSLRVERGG
jgi:nicotinate-nucleotide pyrophosphorylase (carboxylating)